MTPWHILRNAVRRGQPDIRRELCTYLSWLREQRQSSSTKCFGEGELCVIDTKGRVRMMTREAYGEMVYSRKTKRRRKGEYQTVEGKTVKVVEHSPTLDFTQDSDLQWIDEYQRKQQEEADGEAYYGEW